MISTKILSKEPDGGGVHFHPDTQEVKAGGISEFEDFLV